MKLQTLIKPRADGTVILERKDKSDLVFAPAEGYEGLVCDVDDEDLVKQLLMTENFEPADEADFDRATALIGGANTEGTVALNAVSGEPDQDDDQDEDVEQEPTVPDEANTPPVTTGRARAAARSSARAGARR